MHPSTKTTYSSFEHLYANVLCTPRRRWVILSRSEQSRSDGNPLWIPSFYNTKQVMSEACWMHWGNPKTVWVKKVDQVWWVQTTPSERVSNLPVWRRALFEPELMLVGPMGADFDVPAIMAWSAQCMVAQGLSGIRTHWGESAWSHGRAWSLHSQWNGQAPVPGTGVQAGRFWRLHPEARRIKATMTLASKVVLEASCLLGDADCDPKAHWCVIVASALRGLARQLDDISDLDPDYSFQRGRRGVGWKVQKKSWQYGGGRNARCAARCEKYDEKDGYPEC